MAETLLRLDFHEVVVDDNNNTSMQNDQLSR